MKGSTQQAKNGSNAKVRIRGYYRGTMWVLNLPGGYTGKTRFLGRPWTKLSSIGV